jgi:acyl-ACP thioesterase
MYSFDSTVRYSECDERGILSIQGIVNYLQDCSTFHSESLGRGPAFMSDHHFAWLISAWQIELVREARLFDPITVSTWSYGLKRTHSCRSFTITSPDGEPYVRADSQWFVFDTETRRMARVPESEQVYDQGEERIDMPPTRRKLTVAGDYREAPGVLVARQHIDTNGHVNNAQYIQMAFDALDELDIRDAVRRISVQYRSMAFLGDTVIPHVHDAQGGHTVELCDPEGAVYAVVETLSN